jgi:TPR repeat protein
MKRLAGLIALLFAPTLLHAGLMDDWQKCLSSVLNHPGAQNRTDAFSQYCVGLAYMQGHFGKRDPVTAARYYSTAAQQNLPAAQTALGYAYERGYGVPQDKATALQLWHKAAAQGSAEANLLLGESYQAGSGVPKNQAQAVEYYRIAAGLGSEEAKHRLVDLGAESQPGIDLVRKGNDLRQRKDYAGAVAAFRQAAAQGNPYGEASLGIMYEAGWGVPQSDQQAAQWYLKAANQGSSGAQKRIGQLYELGEGVPENWAVALAWYQKSAAQHDPEGEFALGRMYEFGMAVPQNRATAIEWFRKAGEQGNSQAAYFARWLSNPTNNIGFRDDQEQRLVLGGRLPFAIGADDPAGITFRNSSERVEWLQRLRAGQASSESQAKWQVRKNEYDACMHDHGDNCHNPGPRPH